LNSPFVCYYCYPRGDKKEKRVWLCELCKKWFCEEHFVAKVVMSRLEIIEGREGYQGHPCIGFPLQKDGGMKMTVVNGVVTWGR
ncbi:unnamed protein product, partial [marine sediment metagenome]